MSKFVNSVILGLMVFLLLISVYYYWNEVKAPREVGIESIESEWGAVDERVTEVRTTVTFHNPHRTQVQFVQLDYEYLLDGERIDNGTRYQTLRIPPEAPAAVQFASRFPQDFLARWWERYVDGGESSLFVVRGQAVFLVSQQRVIVAFAHESPWHASLPGALQSGLNNCTSDPARLCLDSGELRWTTTSTGSNALLVGLPFRNPNETDVRLDALTVDLWMEGVRVAHATTGQGLTIGPMSTRRVEVVLTMDPAGFQAWWPKHIARCESSSTGLQLQFGLEEDAPQANESEQSPTPPLRSSQNWSFPGNEFQTRFLCSHA